MTVHRKIQDADATPRETTGWRCWQNAVVGSGCQSSAALGPGPRGDRGIPCGGSARHWTRGGQGVSTCVMDGKRKCAGVCPVSWGVAVVEPNGAACPSPDTKSRKGARGWPHPWGAIASSHNSYNARDVKADRSRARRSAPKLLQGARSAKVGRLVFSQGPPTPPRNRGSPACARRGHRRLHARRPSEPPSSGRFWNVFVLEPRARRSNSTHEVTSRMGSAIMVRTYLLAAVL